MAKDIEMLELIIGENKALQSKYVSMAKLWTKANKTKLKSLYDLGKQFTEIKADPVRFTKRGAQLLADGLGMSRKMMYDTIRFYELFSEAYVHVITHYTEGCFITWTHITLIMTDRLSQDQREMLLRQVQKDRLTTVQLRNVICELTGPATSTRGRTRSKDPNTRTRQLIATAEAAAIACKFYYAEFAKQIKETKDEELIGLRQKLVNSLTKLNTIVPVLLYDISVEK